MGDSTSQGWRASTVFAATDLQVVVDHGHDLLGVLLGQLFPLVHAQRHALALGNQQAHQRNHLRCQQGSVQPIDRPLRHRPGVGHRRQLRHLRPVGAVQAAVQQRLEDGVLAVEMGIQPAFGQAAALGNVVHPRRREATARELLQRRVQYLRHALRGCQAQSAPGLSPIVVHHARYCHASKSSVGKTKYAIRYRLVGCYSGLSHAQLPDP